MRPSSIVRARSSSVCENLFLRHIWRAAGAHLGLRQSELLLSLADHLEASDHRGVRDVVAGFRPFAESASITETVRALYLVDAAHDVFAAWWEGVISAASPEEQAFLRELFRFDWLT
jgi:radical SAM C-methyltransferase